jgi:hypothetical protein
MSKGAHDIFVIVVNFILNDLEAKHVTIGLFEVTNTIDIAMILKLQKLLYKFFLQQKFLPMLRTRGLTCKLMQMASFMLCYVG